VQPTGQYRAPAQLFCPPMKNREDSASDRNGSILISSSAECGRVDEWKIAIEKRLQRLRARTPRKFAQAIPV
jgi:hypothetical protein